MCDLKFPIPQEALQALEKVKEVKSEFGDAFILLKDRIEEISQWVELRELELELEREEIGG